MVLVACVFIFGGARLPIEAGLTKQLMSAGLVPPRMAGGTGEKLGQTFSAVSLGGLRTLVATMFNLRAFGFFTEQKWSEVEDTFNLIVSLAPRTRYYWDTGSWHQAYNAASFYLYGETDLPPLRRKLAWRESVLKGEAFLKRAIHNNPNDPQLYESLGRLYSDANKVAAFESPKIAYELSAEAYQKAVATGRARSYTERAAIYSLARVPGREKESLKLLEDYSAQHEFLFPTMKGLLYTLRFHQNPELDVPKELDRIFGSREEAYEMLSNQWLRSRDRFPIDGLAKALQLLESELAIPKAESIFNRELPSPMTPDDYFRR